MNSTSAPFITNPLIGRPRHAGAQLIVQAVEHPPRQLGDVGVSAACPDARPRHAGDRGRACVAPGSRRRQSRRDQPGERAPRLCRARGYDQRQALHVGVSRASGVIRAPVRPAAHDLPLLLELAPAGRPHVPRRDEAAVDERQEGGGHGRGLDAGAVRSSSAASPGQSSSPASDRRRGPARPPVRPPQSLALSGAGALKSIDEPQPPDERGVDVPLAVGGQHRERRRTAPSAAADSRSRCSRSGRARQYLGALAEQRVRLVEQQQRRCALARLEQLAQPFLGLADVLVHDPGEVDADTDRGRARRPAPARPSSCRCRWGRRTARSCRGPSGSAGESPSRRAPAERSRACASSSRRCALALGREHQVVPT